MSELGIRIGSAAHILSAPAPQWYAVHTRSKCEKIAATEIGAKGIAVYLPVRREVHAWSDRKKVVEVPLFPGYLFVHMADFAENRIQVVRSTGAVRILGSSTTIEPVREIEIESVRTLLGSGVPFSSVPFLNEGERVRVRRGALEGVEGILTKVRSSTRLTISVEMLSQSVSVEIDAHNVEAVERRSRRRALTI